MRNQWWNHFKVNRLIYNKWLAIGGSLLLLGVVMFLMVFSNVQTKTYDIQRFETAKETIMSPVNIEDEQKTDERRREAIDSVEDIYSVNQAITAKRINYIKEMFGAVSAAEKSHQQENVNVDEAGNSEDTSQNVQDVDKEELLQHLLSKEISSSVPSNVFRQLLLLSKEKREAAEDLVVNAISEQMNEGIQAGDVFEAKKNTKEKLDLVSFNTSIQQALHDMVDFAIVQNSFIDLEKTNQAKQDVAHEVQPVMIKQGQVIVFQGERITEEVYQTLALVGLLDSKSNTYPYIGLIILIVLSLAVMGHEMNRMYNLHTLDMGTMASLFVISVLIFGFMKLGSVFQSSLDNLYFAIPLASGAILLKLLINERIAILFSVVFAVFGTVFFNQQIPGTLNVEAGLYFIFSQLASILFLQNVKDRVAIIKAGIGVMITNVLIVVMFMLLSYELLSWTDITTPLLYGVLAAFSSTVLTFGLLPLFETGLGILSDTKLLTLANPNHPLLRKILTETPGTYHHSVMVANLSEAACEAIGANGLLARVAAYYHDLGKTYKPHYFIENQMGMKNPHDRIEPKQSAEIIIEHPYVGANLLRKHRMPKEIVNIAEQHHGTTLLKYFYYKHKEQNPKVKEEEFRYPGPKPQSKEAAIVCLCDSIEAAVRSLKHPSTDEIEKLVHSIITDRMLDGQLSDSPLTLKDTERIQVAICETLKGIFHSRIQYPEEATEPVKEAK